MSEAFRVTSYEDVLNYARERYAFYQEKRTKKALPNIITTEKDLRTLSRLLLLRPAFAYDTEADGTRVNAPGVVNLVGISISWGYNHTYYIPCGHITGEKQVSIDKVIKYLKPAFEKKDTLIVGHNLKYDMHILANYGINIRPKADTGKLFDTMRACWLCDENAPNGLKENSLKITGIRMLNFEEVAKLGIEPDFKKELGLKANQIGTIDAVSIEIAGAYALDDAYCTWEIYKYYDQKLKEEGYYDYYYQIDIPYNCGVLFDKEREGIRVDLKKLDKLEKAIRDKMEQLKYEIVEALGYDFNMNSPDQLRYVLYDHLKFPVLGTTKSGNATTDKDTIDELCNRHYKSKRMQKNVKILEKIRDYRRLDKLTGFIKGIRENLYPDGKIHCSFKQLTVTGRLSCTDINMQQQPDVEKLDEDDVRREFNLREVYVPDSEDQVIIASDFSNLELRLLAHFSEDENLVDAFRRGQDVHSRTALTMFEPVPAKEYLKKDPLLKDFKNKWPHLRSAGKTLNFGLIYGMQAPKFAGTMSKLWKREVTVEEAQDMYDSYFEKLPGVQRFITSTKQLCKRQGFVNTILGRKRRLPDIWSSRGFIRARAERQAVNSIIQGSAADIVIAVQLKMSRDKLLRKWGVKMLLQVHDEVVFQCPKKNVKKAVKRIAELMSKPFTEPLIVDLVVEPGVGKSWAEAK